MADSHRRKKQVQHSEQPNKGYNKMASQMNPLNVGFLKVKSRNYSDRSIKNCGRMKNDYQSTSKRYKVFGLKLANKHYFSPTNILTAKTENQETHLFNTTDASIINANTRITKKGSKRKEYILYKIGIDREVRDYYHEPTKVEHKKIDKNTSIITTRLSTILGDPQDFPFL